MSRWLGMMLLVALAWGVCWAAPPRVSHGLAWEYAGTATQFVLEQCSNTPSGCPMVVVATLPGSQRAVELGGLQRRTTYCWRLTASYAGGQTLSNVVCTS
jgi:hypothetical protein